MNPYDKEIRYGDGTPKCLKVHVLYVDGDAKLCDGCDQLKTGVASINTIGNGVMCICQQCVKDILTVWGDETKKPIDITHKMI